VVAQPELLAHHHTEAGSIDGAVEYWRKAGELALARSAYPEAVSHFARGIEVVRLLPAGPARDRRELNLYVPLGPAIRAIKGFAAPQTLQVYSRARDLLRDSTPLQEQLAVRLGMWTVYWGRAEHASAYRLARQCLSLALRHPDASAIARTSRILGMTLWTMGKFGEARTALQRCLDINATTPQSGRFPGHDDRVAALSFMAGSLWLLGYPDQARRAASDAIARAEVIGQPTTIAFARYWEAIFGGFGPDPEGAAARTDALVALCAKHRVASFEHLARVHQGAQVAQQGDPPRGIAIMRDAMAAHAEAAGRASRPMHLGHLATAEAATGHLGVALGLLDQAILEAEAAREKFFLAELHHQRGTLLAQQGKHAKAITALQNALSIARGQDAKFWELRAATTLADLLVATGRSLEARHLLAPLVGWFTEGFDLPDLTRAKALLAKTPVQPGHRRAVGK
jgi:predicted ATPase